MRIRFYILLLALAAWLVPGTLFAQKACTVLSSDVRPFREAVEGFKSSFKGSVEVMVLPPDPSQAGQLVSKIKGSGCDVVVPMGSGALKFLRIRLTDKPMVYAMTLSPSVAGTKGLDMTGVYLESSPERTLSTIRRIFPAARRIGVLHSSTQAGDYLSIARRDAAAMGIELVTVRTPKVGDAIREIPSLMTRCDVILMIPDLVTSTQSVFKALLAASFRNNVPLFALAQKHVEAGALAALATDYRENGRQAGAMARRVAGGSRASAIKPEHSDTAGIVINLKTAKRMGINVPATVTIDAAHVYR